MVATLWYAAGRIFTLSPYRFVVWVGMGGRLPFSVHLATTKSHKMTKRDKAYRTSLVLKRTCGLFHIENVVVCGTIVA
jgi:hypothetical protein